MEKKSLQKSVLDAWALLALIQGEEPAASRVMEIIGEAEEKRVLLCMSWINLGEVYYRIGRQKGQPEARETLDEILLLPIRFYTVNKDAILAAAENKMKFAISYSDAFAVALAQSLNGTIITGDSEILRIDHVVSVERLDRHAVKSR